MILIFDILEATLIKYHFIFLFMKVISISLTLEQLKELCEKRITEITLNQGSSLLRIKVKMPGSV